MVTTNEKSIVGYTQKRKRNPNITLKIAIKSQKKKRKRNGKKMIYKVADKQVTK